MADMPDKRYLASPAFSKKIRQQLYGVILVTLSFANFFVNENEEVNMNNNVALFVRLEAINGRESEVERFLQEGLTLAENEPGTSSWFALRLGKSTFGIFDTFPNEKSRKAHLAGEIAKALKDKAPDLFSTAPLIEEADILASKMPEPAHH